MDSVGIGLAFSVLIFIAVICIAAKFADIFYTNSDDDDDIL